MHMCALREVVETDAQVCEEFAHSLCIKYYYDTLSVMLLNRIAISDHRQHINSVLHVIALEARHLSGSASLTRLGLSRHWDGFP